MKIEYDNVRIEYVHASEVFDDDNDGYVYGINYIDENNEIIEDEWYKTEWERDIAASSSGYKIIN